MSTAQQNYTACEPSILSVQGLELGVHSVSGIKTLVGPVSFDLHSGQCLALVGESGSGKSLTALACTRLLPDAIVVTAGDVLLSEKSIAQDSKTVNLLDLPRHALQHIRGKRIAMVFQEPSLALNPVLTIGEQLSEAFSLHSQLTGAALKSAIIHALSEVGIELPEQRLNDYPLQFSGGQKQRIMIAMALAGQPDILIADEPTTALDVVVQTQILVLLNTLKSSRNMALLLITHDLGVVKHMADDVVVMQAGYVIERARAVDFFKAPTHPHSQALLAASRSQALYQPSPNAAQTLLNVAHLSTGYTSKSSAWRNAVLNPVLQDIHLALGKGETLAIVGASGSGKTTLAKVLLGLQDQNLRSTGHITLNGVTRAAHQMPNRSWQKTLSVVFQDPFASLNPRMRVGDIVMEGVLQLRPEWSAHQAQSTIAALLQAVELPSDCLSRWPHEFSGGQRQRIAILRALAIEPALVVLDEPTSALDLTIQSKLLALLIDLQQRFGYSYLLITHNFQVVQALAQHVAVLDKGSIVEYGATASVLNAPQHPQTKRLLSAITAV